MGGILLTGSLRSLKPHNQGGQICSTFVFATMSTQLLRNVLGNDIRTVHCAVPPSGKSLLSPPMLATNLAVQLDREQRFR
jgi:hypothetical protein